jgi:uncharacterized YccA/Bax inhibitor family protein
MAALAGILGILLISAAFQGKYAYPVPVMFFLAACGLFVGAIILLLLVVIIEEIQQKEANNETH